MEIRARLGMKSLSHARHGRECSIVFPEGKVSKAAQLLFALHSPTWTGCWGEGAARARAHTASWVCWPKAGRGHRPDLRARQPARGPLEGKGS